MKPRLLGVAVLLTASATLSGDVIVSDDFESGRWASYWQEEIPYDYSTRVVEDPAGQGKSLRFEWREADYEGNRKTKGAELRTPKFSPTEEQWLGFRIYFDREEFGPDTEPVIIMQYHGSPDFDEGEDWRNPVTALSYRDGRLSYSYRGSRQRVTPGKRGDWTYSERGGFSMGEPAWDAWNTFVFHHRFDPTGHDGLIEAWFNGRKFVREGINVGFNDERGPYWKYGFYYYKGESDHDRRVMYVDDVTVGGPGASYADVEPR